MGILVALHVVAAIIWVGGLFFAFFCLRPATARLDSADRCRLWHGVLRRFFAIVWIAIAVLLATGYGMIGGYLGGMANAGMHVHLMHAGGLLMMALFLHVWFAPFRKLSRAVAADDWPAAAAQIGRIRPVVAVNVTLGLAIAAIGAGGRWY